MAAKPPVNRHRILKINILQSKFTTKTKAMYFVTIEVTDRHGRPKGGDLAYRTPAALGNPSPVWNQTCVFSLPLRELHTFASTLVVKVWAVEGRKEKLVGKLPRITIAGINEYDVDARWIPLEGKMDSIHLKLGWYGAKDPKANRPSSKKPLLGSSGPSEFITEVEKQVQAAVKEKNDELESLLTAKAASEAKHSNLVQRTEAIQNVLKRFRDLDPEVQKCFGGDDIEYWREAKKKAQIVHQSHLKLTQTQIANFLKDQQLLDKMKSKKVIDVPPKAVALYLLSCKEEENLSFNGIKRKLGVANGKWFKGFFDEEGLKCIYTVMKFFEDQELNIPTSLKQLDLSLCLKMIFNNQFACEYILKQLPEVMVDIIALVLNSKNTLMKVQMFQLFAALCIYGRAGHELVLKGIASISQKNINQPLTQLIRILKEEQDPDMLASIFCLINGIIAGEKELGNRMKIRTQFLALGVRQIMQDLISNYPKESKLLTQIETFETIEKKDQDELRELKFVGSKDLSKPQTVFQLILSQVEALNLRDLFLRHIQHVMLIPSKCKEPLPAWEFIEKSSRLLTCGIGTQFISETSKEDIEQAIYRLYTQEKHVFKALLEPKPAAPNPALTGSQSSLPPPLPAFTPKPRPQLQDLVNANKPLRLKKPGSMSDRSGNSQPRRNLNSVPLTIIKESEKKLEVPEKNTRRRSNSKDKAEEEPRKKKLSDILAPLSPRTRADGKKSDSKTFGAVPKSLQKNQSDSPKKASSGLGFKTSRDKKLPDPPSSPSPSAPPPLPATPSPTNQTPTPVRPASQIPPMLGSRSRSIKPPLNPTPEPVTETAPTPTKAQEVPNSLDLSSLVVKEEALDPVTYFTNAILEGVSPDKILVNATALGIELTPEQNEELMSMLDLDDYVNGEENTPKPDFKMNVEGESEEGVGEEKKGDVIDDDFLVGLTPEELEEIEWNLKELELIREYRRKDLDNIIDTPELDIKDLDLTDIENLENLEEFEDLKDLKDLENMDNLWAKLVNLEDSEILEEETKAYDYENDNYDKLGLDDAGVREDLEDNLTPEEKEMLGNTLLSPRKSEKEAMTNEEEELMRKLAKDIDDVDKMIKEENKPKKKVSLLPPRIAQNISIMKNQFRHFKTDEDIILNLFNRNTTDPYETHHRQALLNCFPAEEHIEALVKYNGLEEDLGGADFFVRELCAFPHLKDILKVHIFWDEFESRKTSLLNNIDVMLVACQEILNSQKLRTIVGLILSIGNFLNSGTNRAKVRAFKTSTFKKLGELRSPSVPGYTLTKYVAQFVSDRMPDLLDFEKEIPHLYEATRSSLDMISDEMKNIQTGLVDLDYLIEKLNNIDKSSHYYHFFRAIVKFSFYANDEWKQIEETYQEFNDTQLRLIKIFSHDSNIESLWQNLEYFVKGFTLAIDEAQKKREEEESKIKMVFPTSRTEIPKEKKEEVRWNEKWDNLDALDDDDDEDDAFYRDYLKKINNYEQNDAEQQPEAEKEQAPAPQITTPLQDEEGVVEEEIAEENEEESTEDENEEPNGMMDNLVSGVLNGYYFLDN
eukprot:TRINITY_DN7442_c0_g1_i3.p1 TRINITY_DN7442_c0_g1~~TRINITY_DN7442_c0_g1_i3.p1  ORF type:complete len:1549 (+),score=508.37 TRINITY_DN7442_c0_g1_i3:36-4682(+)